ncbi:MAG: alpha/beta fold hydrolase [Candidatus Cloacimonetes bacterium]|nr:alpha/beta fold hydrolase [Candidatus Cloacimonadota bacterium]
MDFTKHHQPFSNVSQNDIGILLIHGFTSTTSSMMYLAEQFSKEGYNVELPRLSGHGTHWQDLDNVVFEDWINDLEEALDILKKRSSKIFLCGLSLGGALAVRLTQKQNFFKGIILINHACVFTNPKFWFVPILKHIIPSVPAVANDIKDPNSKEIAYTKTSLKGLFQLLRLIKTIKKDLFKITCPILIFKSKEDHVIPIKSATYTMKMINSKQKELIWLENSYHVATLDFDKDVIMKKSIEFVRQLSK